MTPPLAGLRVVDLSRVLAGPYCTMLLADLGADVVKIERPGAGDETRGWGPPFLGDDAAYFMAVNRGKRSCAIDLASDAGRELVQELCSNADVVVENFRPGGAERLGLGFAQLERLNPRLIYCSVTGFGSSRSPADRSGYDFIVQAESGLMSITGDADGPPTKVGVAVVDVLAGLNAAVAILAALERRRHTGAGSRVETSLLDSALSALVNQAQSALADGEAPRRLGNAHPSIVPYETFATRDGVIAIAAANDRLFGRLCTVLDLSEVAADPRFATNAARVANRAALISMLSDRIAGQASDTILEALTAARVPCGRIRDIPDALAAAAAAGDRATFTLNHPALGELTFVRNAISIDGASPTAGLPPPQLGEHTGEILGALGRSEAQIAALVAAGIVQAGATS